MSHVIVVCRSVTFYLVEEALENTNEENKSRNPCDEQAQLCLCVSAIASLALVRSPFVMVSLVETNGRVHITCINASNLFHECSDYCFPRITQA